MPIETPISGIMEKETFLKKQAKKNDDAGDHSPEYYIIMKKFDEMEGGLKQLRDIVKKSLK